LRIAYYQFELAGLVVLQAQQTCVEHGHAVGLAEHDVRRVGHRMDVEAEMIFQGRLH
jgi:ribosomal protein S27AE